MRIDDQDGTGTPHGFCTLCGEPFTGDFHRDCPNFPLVQYRKKEMTLLSPSSSGSAGSTREDVFLFLGQQSPPA